MDNTFFQQKMKKYVQTLKHSNKYQEGKGSDIKREGRTNKNL